MKCIIVGIVVIALVYSCNFKENKPKILHEDRLLSFIPQEKGEAVSYFPVDTGSKNQNILENWASQSLYALKEPVLYNSYSSNGIIFRFTWLRSFENPIVLRLNKFGDTIYAVIKELKVTNNPNKSSLILRDTIVVLDNKDWQEISAPLIQISDLRNKEAENDLNQDGAIWFLEYRNNSNYNITQGWDSGSLLSHPLKKYFEPLLSFANKNVHLKSVRVSN